MRCLTIILTIILLHSCAKEKSTLKETIKRTKVDSISNLNELRTFIKTTDSTLNQFLYATPKSYNQEGFHVAKIKRRLDSMFPNITFIKEDFDANGFTDLIITGAFYQHSFKVMAIMNYGNDHYAPIPLTLSLINDFPIYPKLVYKDEIPAVELYSISNYAENFENGISKTTLVYKYGRFIDFNEEGEDYQISQIEYRAEGCFGTCPVFELVLNENAKSSFIARYHNFSKTLKIDPNKEEGYFETTIAKDKFSELCEIINYLQIKNLSDSYFAGGTCQPSCTLKVYFTDGTVKTIEDYGKSGTNGLYYLYRKLSDLRFNQDWEKL
ncbi:DUF6438 domain-containing protein [uncultured Psychroserpens sp.]|uniref:DUF6438 domain-containing protein n=1 Tax=uncultured Psychroserpens sp. TaxID=255436 RepID=UPI00260C09B1|nr:DUF6438 domain-containing protein [uncultured Psychroserpens sp.]